MTLTYARDKINITTMSYKRGKFGRFTRAAILCLVSAVVVISTVASTAFLTSPASAAGNQGSQETAYKKLYYMAFSQCLTNGQHLNAYIYDSTKIHQDAVKDLRWFRNNGVLNNGGVYIEVQIEGKYDNGIGCGDEKNGQNILVSQALSALGIDNPLDIICNSSNHNESGIFKYNGNRGQQTCESAYNDKDADFVVSEDAGTYLSELVAEKAFDNNVPGDSLTTLTDLEKYYVYRFAFENACAKGEPVFGENSLDYKVYTWNSTDKEFQKAGYNQRENGNENKLIGVYGSSQMTCSGLVAALNPEKDANGNNANPIFTAYRNHQYSDATTAQADCLKSIQQQLADALKYRDSNENLTEEQKTKISEFLNKHQVIENLDVATLAKMIQENPDLKNNAALKWDEDGINLVCRDSEVKEAWAKLVADLNLPDAPGLDGTFDQNDYITPDGETQTEGVAATCSSSAGGLGWVACEVADFLAKALQWVYEDVIEPSLTVSTKLVDTESGTYNAWSLFRNIANIIFVIFLLIVIFSQLTGVGIDNYGIKKSLPKLIVAAILVNISFFICQGAVDISNILGKSLFSFLKSIPFKVPEATLDAYSANGLSIAGSITITAAFAAAIVGGGIWAFSTGVLTAGTLLIPLLSILVGAVVGALFMFILLGMRQALVVILVVLSPLAFVCYMLPNTKSLFDKWLNLGKAMLLLFPICSLVMGAGYLVSRILIASGGASANFFILLTAIVAEIGPFFLIPGLTRSAYKATGELGARLNGLAGRARQGSRGLIDNSNVAKRENERRAAIRQSYLDNKNLKAAQKRATRLENKRTKKGYLSRRNEALLSASNRRANELAKKQGEEENWRDKDFVDSNRRLASSSVQQERTNTIIAGQADVIAGNEASAKTAAEIKAADARSYANNKDLSAKEKFEANQARVNRSIEATEFMRGPDSAKLQAGFAGQLETNRIMSQDKLKSYASGTANQGRINENQARITADERRAAALANTSDAAFQGLSKKLNLDTDEGIKDLEQYGSNPDLEQADINQGIIKRDEKSKRAKNLLSGDYVKGQKIQNTLNATKDLKSTILNVQDEVRQGKENEIEVDVYHQEKVAKLNNEPDYLASRKNQVDATISNATTKMYEDQFSRMTQADVLKNATDALTPGAKNSTERITAALQTLKNNSAPDQMMNFMDNNSSAFHTAIQTAAANSQPEVIDQYLQSLATSGVQPLVEYSKHVREAVANGGAIEDFKTFTGKGGTLSQKLADRKADALVGLDKDILDFYAGPNHIGAIEGLAGNTFAKGMAGANGKEIGKYVKIISQLNGAKVQEIVDNMTAEQFASTNDEIRTAIVANIRNGNPSATETTVFGKQITDVNNNANISSKMSQADRTKYGIQNQEAAARQQQQSQQQIQTEVIVRQTQDAHVARAQQIGIDPVTKIYPIPSGYTHNLSDPANIYRDGFGHSYDAGTNKFF